MCKGYFRIYALIIKMLLKSQATILTEFVITFFSYHTLRKLFPDI